VKETRLEKGFAKNASYEFAKRKFISGENRNSNTQSANCY